MGLRSSLGANQQRLLNDGQTPGTSWRELSSSTRGPTLVVENLVVFTSNLTYSVRKGIVDILETHPDIRVLIAHQNVRPNARRLIRNQWRNTQKHGWRWIPHQTKNIAERVAQRIAQLRHNAAHAQTDAAAVQAGNRPGTQYTLSNLLAGSNVDYFECRSLRSESALSRIAAFGPDLGVALAAPILKDTVFSIPALGTINLHKGQVPFYRGMPPAFWELWNDEPEVGCTVHKVEAGLDTGDVLLQSAVQIAKYSTVKGLQLALDEMGVRLVTQAVGRLKTNAATWTPQPSGGTTYTAPTLKQEQTLRRKLKTPSQTGVAKRLIKDLVFSCYADVVRPIPRRYLGARNNQRVVVVLYHRVNDDCVTQ